MNLYEYDKQYKQALEKSERRFANIYRAVIFVLLVVVGLYLVHMLAYAEARHEDVKKTETIYRLTQCVIAECDRCKTNPRERDAIGHCLKKQAFVLDKTLLQQTVDYCAFYKRKSQRARAIFESDYFDPLHGDARLWLESKKWAVAFIENPPPDPEPLANHWGGPKDIANVQRYQMKRIAGPPQYANTFYQTRQWRRLWIEYANRLHK